MATVRKSPRRSTAKRTRGYSEQKAERIGKQLGLRFPAVFVRGSGVLIHGLILPVYLSAFVRELNKRCGMNEAMPLGESPAVWCTAGIMALAAMSRAPKNSEMRKVGNAILATAFGWCFMETNGLNGTEPNPDVLAIAREGIKKFGQFNPAEGFKIAPLTKREVFGKNIPRESKGLMTALVESVGSSAR